MIICLFGFANTISRLLTFVCLLLIVFVIQSGSSVALDEPPTIKYTSLSYRSENFIDENTNESINDSSISDEVCRAETIEKSWFSSLFYRIIAGALIVPIIFCSILGNILVIYVIKHFRALRVTGNVFLASLAVADVGVSTLAMTFYGLQLLQGKWILGAFMCRLWFSCDVLFSTASIMHLACIALDRYLSIVHPFQHERKSSKRRRYAMIFGCWFGSALLSFIPIFTGIYTTREQRHKIDCLNHVDGRCLFIVNQAYAIVSSLCSFWVPSAVMIIMYAMLIKIADEKEREAHRQMDSVAYRRRISQSAQSYYRRKSSDDQGYNESSNLQNTHGNHEADSANIATGNGHPNQGNRRSCKHDSIDTQMERHESVDGPVGLLDPRRNSEMKYLKRERRAVKTLGAIMLAFLICWLPFFIRYSACEPTRCQWPFMRIVEDLVFWIGYFNSMINPFLYAFHNRDFRNAFQKTLSPYIVCLRHRRTSTSSLIPLPPATPSGDFKRTSSKMKQTKARSSSKPNVLDARRESSKNGELCKLKTKFVEESMENGEDSGSKFRSIV